MRTAAVMVIGVMTALAGPTVPACGASLAEVAPWMLAVTGNLKGTYTPVEGRSLAWRVTWAPSVNGTAVRTGEVVVEGPDLALRLAVDRDAASERVQWRVTEGRVGIAAWLAALSTHPKLASALAGVTATGELILTGEGAWAGPTLTGVLGAEWDGGTLAHAVQGWTLSGIHVRAGGEVARLVDGHIPLTVEIGTIATDRFGARNFAATATVEGGEALAVQTARIEIAGGEVEVKPFMVPLASWQVGADLVMSRVGLQDLIVFVPTTVSDARGRINGRLHLDWSPSDGVRIGVGELSLDRSEPTTLRLVSDPGFLTKSVPVEFVIAPWLGRLKGLVSAKNPSYPVLSDIETGRLGLRVDTLDVRLIPEGDERGRSASVFIAARPERDGSAVRAVTFQINVAGPLAEVLKLGMEQNLSVETR